MNVIPPLLTNLGVFVYLAIGLFLSSRYASEDEGQHPQSYFMLSGFAYTFFWPIAIFVNRPIRALLASIPLIIAVAFI